MPGKVRAVRTPPAGLVQTGERNKGYRFMSGSMGAAELAAPTAAEPFEAGVELSAAEIAQREAALGLPPEPESVPATFDFQPPRSILPGRMEYVSRPLRQESPDLTDLPDRFSLDIERKGSLWVVRAPSVHVALFVSHDDLVEALAAAPGRLAEIVGVDGIVPAKRKGKK